MEPEEPPEQNVYSEVTRMGSRGQSRKRQLAQLDRASDKYWKLQERSDSINGVGGRFYDRNGREVSREEVEKLSEDLNASRERFEDLRDRMIERENAAAQRARERAEKRQATRERQAAKMPAGVRVTFPDGTQRYYAKGPNGSVVDERGLPVESVGNMSYRDLLNRMSANNAGGFRVENVSSADLNRMQAEYNKSLRDNTDYELGIGTPWDNREYRRGARRNRLANRSQTRNR